jgi:hypothetical protein
MRRRSALNGCSFLSAVIAFAVLSLDSKVGWTQQTTSALYFAREEVRLARLIERKTILNYQVVPLEERRYRETYFDTVDMSLYQQRMFYRIKESFDGRPRIELFHGGAAKNRSLVESMHSAALPASAVLAVREGRLDDPVLSRGLPLPGGRDFKNIQLVAEYTRHSVALEQLGKREFVVSLLAGSFSGFSGKKIHTGFLALEIDTAASRPTSAQQDEVERIAKFLIEELKLKSETKSLYAQGIEKAVLLRPDERRIHPVRIIGGAKGNGIDQFDSPDAVAFTLDGRLVAGDTDNARFKIYSLEDQFQTVQIVGREGSAAGEFGHSLAATLGSFKIYNQVQGIAIDNSGLIYVIDQGNQRIQLFDASGKVLPEKTLSMLKAVFLFRTGAPAESIALGPVASLTPAFTCKSSIPPPVSRLSIIRSRWPCIKISCSWRARARARSRSSTGEAGNCPNRPTPLAGTSSTAKWKGLRLCAIIYSPSTFKITGSRFLT